MSNTLTIGLILLFSVGVPAIGLATSPPMLAKAPEEPAETSKASTNPASKNPNKIKGSLISASQAKASGQTVALQPVKKDADAKEDTAKAAPAASLKASSSSPKAPDSAKTTPSTKTPACAKPTGMAKVPPAPLNLIAKKFPQGTLYTLTVPAKSRYKVMLAQSKTTAGIESPTWETVSGIDNPVFLINGGFFDPNNHQTTSYIFEDGVITGDPKLNTQLTGNPKLIPYLPKIFNRTEFRIYLCRPKNGPFQTRYDIVPHDAAIPNDCLLQESLGAGPVLLPQLGDQEEGFVDYNAQGKLTRDPIGVSARNARSALGITQRGDVILVMGSEDPANPKGTGFSLPEIASLLKARGAVKAMGLDGGSSSGFLYKGKATYGKFNANGTPIKRPVKSILLVSPF